MTSKYEYEFDPIYCYPNSSILVNKYNVKREEVFEDMEREFTSLRMAQVLHNKISGNFDANHLKAIHKYLFQDLYSWAGEFRMVNISKGCMFCFADYIEHEINRIFRQLKAEKYLRGIVGHNIAKRLAYYFSEINAIHPFREGNGRTQRVFIEHLARYCGWSFDLSKIDSKEMIDASIESFQQNYTPMEEIFGRCLRKIENPNKTNIDLNDTILVV